MSSPPPTVASVPDLSSDMHWLFLPVYKWTKTVYKMKETATWIRASYFIRYLTGDQGETLTIGETRLDNERNAGQIRAAFEHLAVHPTLILHFMVGLYDQKSTINLKALYVPCGCCVTQQLWILGGNFWFVGGRQWRTWRDRVQCVLLIGRAKGVNACRIGLCWKSHFLRWSHEQSLGHFQC